jgi:hypothetical protein
MKHYKIATAVFAALALTMAAPAEAKKTSGGKGKGLYCQQGGQNVFIPAAQLPAKVRPQLIKGKKATVNIAGFGPVACVVY